MAISKIGSDGLNQAADTILCADSGNVGIGTSSPSVKLDVVGSTTSGLRLRSSSGASNGFNIYNDSGTDTASLINFYSGPMVFGTGNTERARIDSSGNLLVGTTTSGGSGSGVQVYNWTGTAGALLIKKTYDGQATAIGNFHNGTYVGGIEYSNTATSFPTSSDARLKKDIVGAGSASEKIEQIRIVSHGWKHDDEIVEFGVIAQELCLITPQAVIAGDEGEVIEKTWGVDYSKLVPVLIKAHQEQQAIIDEQKTALEALTARVSALEAS